MKRVQSLILWSVIAAAFIGPGTVTTASKAGSQYGLGLLWALVFSVLATILLQEASARIRLATGQGLGHLLGRHSQSFGYRSLLFGAVALGCGAYEAGNLLGAWAGLQLLGVQDKAWILLPGIAAFLLLWRGTPGHITRFLALTVALMGLVFVAVGWGNMPAPAAWYRGLAPQVNDDNALLVIGLIGTTIVPYNLFLANTLSKGQTLPDMRWGLVLATLLGGIITLAILLTGMLVSGEFSFQALAAALEQQLGAWGRYFLGLGLFAAGFSSAITAPLAAALAGQSLALPSALDKWEPTGQYYRITWVLILLLGLFFALSNVQPIPAIIAAQAVNGVILPGLAILLLLKVNDAAVLEAKYRNTLWLNVASVLVVGVTVFLGLHNIWLALAKVLPALEWIPFGTRAVANMCVAALTMLWLGLRIGKL